MTQTHSLDLERSSSQYASITDASQTGLDLSTDFTFEAWIKLEQLPSTAGGGFMILSKTKDAGVQRSYGLTITTADKLRVNYSSNGNYTAGNNEVIDSTAAMFVSGNVGTWVHVAVSVDISAKTAIMYKNGLSVGTTEFQSGGTTIYNSTAQFEIGNDSEDNGQLYDGLIKDVRVFSDIRTQGEIIADAYVENVTDANLEGEWNFNNAYTDSSGNGNTLTASGSPTFSADIPWDPATVISLDTAVDGGYSTGTTLTFAVTIAEADEVLFVGIKGNTTDNITGVTYDGVAMTLVDKGAPSGGRYGYLYYLLNPSTGANNVVVTASGADQLHAGAAAYKGMKQQAPEATKKVVREAASGTNAYTDITTITDEAWVVGTVITNDNYSAPYGSTTKVRATFSSTSTRCAMVDSEEVATAGSVDLGIVIADDPGNAWTIVLAAMEAAGGTAYTKDLTDAIALADSYAKLTGKINTEVVTLVDTIIKSSEKTLTDVVTLVSSINIDFIYTRAYTETITLVDNIYKQTSKTVADTVTAVDTIIRNTAKSLTDTVVLVATEAINTVYAKTLTDAIALVDTTTRLAGKVITETLVIADTITKSIGKLLTDVVTLVSTIATVTAKSFTDAVTVTDSIIKTTNKVLTEAITLVATVADRLTGMVLRETIVLAETFTKLRTAYKSLTETVTLTEVFTKAATLAITLVERISLTERLRGLLNGVNMLYNNKYTAKVVTYINKYIDPK